MKTPASIETIKTAAEKVAACQAFLYGSVLTVVTPVLRAMRHKMFTLIMLCILMPGYGDNYVTYAVGSMAVYTTGRVLINNVATKKREGPESEPPAKCDKVSGTCTKSEGLTDGSLWN